VKLLLDTHTLLWLVDGDVQLSQPARDAVSETACSICQLANKQSLWFALVLSAFLVFQSGAAAADDISWDKLPSFYYGSEEKYRVDPYIDALAKLRAAGKDNAITLLRAEVKKSGSDTVIALCRMLFAAKPDGEFRQPRLGAPFLVGGANMRWPLEPFEIVDGVPFLVVRGYNLIGSQERAEKYFNYCVEECTWGTTEFRARSAEEKSKALEKLLSSKKWKTPPTDEEKAFLESQLK
jgi:hypothetical protein